MVPKFPATGWVTSEFLHEDPKIAQRCPHLFPIQVWFLDWTAELFRILSGNKCNLGAHLDAGGFDFFGFPLDTRVLDRTMTTAKRWERLAVT